MTDCRIYWMACYGLGNVESESWLCIGFLRDGFYYDLNDLSDYGFSWIDNVEFKYFELRTFS